MKKKRGRPSNAEKFAEAARNELIRREESSKDMVKFADFMIDDFKVGKHTRIIADVLTDIAKGNRRFVLLSVPPRHGKSFLVSELFPAFFIGNNPDKRLITASCTSDLSMDFSRKVRNLVASDKYKLIFPDVELAKDSNRQDRFHTTDNGGLLSAGVGSLITGFGGHCLIVDDPIKGSSDAMSPTVMEKLWLWYRSELRTRAMPGSSIVVIQTRWSERDLIARLIEQKEQGLGDPWEVINIPAYDESGNVLWPEVFSKEEMESVRQTIGDREFNALYMGDPSPETGSFFHSDDILFTDDYPGEGRYYISCDLAASEKGDYTALTVARLTKGGQLIIVDGYRGRVSPEVWIERLTNLVKRYKPHKIFQESGPIYSSCEKYIYASFKDNGTYAKMEKYTSYKDKEGKAQSLKAAFSERKVLLYKTPFTDALMDELVSFPFGRHDDLVDSASMLTNCLGDKLFSHKKIVGHKKKEDSWDRAERLMDRLRQRNNWKTK